MDENEQLREKLINIGRIFFLVILGTLFIITIVALVKVFTNKKAGVSRHHRNELLPGGGLGTDQFPMRYSPNIYVGPPRGTGYEPYWYAPPPPPSYNDEQYYNPYSYPYSYPYFYNVRAPLRYPYYY